MSELNESYVAALKAHDYPCAIGLLARAIEKTQLKHDQATIWLSEARAELHRLRTEAQKRQAG